MTHEQGNGQKEGQQEETGQDIVGEAGSETREAGKQTTSGVMAANVAVRDRVKLCSGPKQPHRVAGAGR